MQVGPAIPPVAEVSTAGCLHPLCQWIWWSLAVMWLAPFQPPTWCLSGVALAAVAEAGGGGGDWAGSKEIEPALSQVTFVVHSAVDC